MFSDSTEETLTLRMGDLRLQLPRQLRALSPSPPLATLFPQKSELDFQDQGFDFYSSPFDNSFPYRGILNNERTTFSSSPTVSNTSFLSETSFTQTLKCSQDNGNNSDNSGLLTTSMPYHGNEQGPALNTSDLGGSFLSQGSHLNDSLSSSIGIPSQKWDSPIMSTTTVGGASLFDFSFPSSQPSLSNAQQPTGNQASNSWSGTTDSPSRLTDGNNASLANQWNSSDVSSLLDQSAESSSSSSVITTSALGNPNWSPSQVSSSSPTSNGQQWDSSILINLSREQLFEFVELAQEKYDECVREGDIDRAAQVQGLIVQAQKYLISSFRRDSNGSNPNTPTNNLGSPLMENPFEKSAFSHRAHAGTKDAPYMWSGSLPARNYKNAVYSNKVFLGGLPWDISESILFQAFKQFGVIRIEMPNKDGVVNPNKRKGYAYAVFENEKQVKHLLQSCTHDFSSSKSGNYYFKLSSKKFRGKDVEIIPWTMYDSVYPRSQSYKIDPQKTIFVGGVHGMVNAEGLATIMQDLFGPVMYTAVDSDRNKYPIGSARVTFTSVRSYFKAIKAAFVHVKTPRIDKVFQVDPYLEDAKCSTCIQQGIYFCRDISCFSYYCLSCFQERHACEQFSDHRPIFRTTNNKQQYGKYAMFNNNNNSSSSNSSNGHYNNYGNNNQNGFGHGNSHHNSNFGNGASHHTGFGNNNGSHHHNNFGNGSPHNSFGNGGPSRQYGNHSFSTNGNGLLMNSKSTSSLVENGAHFNSSSMNNTNGGGGGGPSQHHHLSQRNFGQVGHRQQQFMRW